MVRGEFGHEPQRRLRLYERPLWVSRIDNRRMRSTVLPTVHTLGAALSPGGRRALRAAIALLDQQATPRRTLWVVGGAVRDVARGAPVRDLDLAIEGPPASLARALARALDAHLTIEPRFRTATLQLPGGERLDLAMLRTETYARPGALPVVRPARAIEADLARRDFTVNALALGVAGVQRGELIDPFDGLGDLRRGVLRVLHPASFRDDPTRLWRGARFAARLRLRPEPATAALITASTGEPRALSAISAARLWAEWTQVAAEPRAGVALRLLDEWEVLSATAPGWHLGAAPSALNAHRGPHPPDLLLAVVLASQPAPTRAAVLARLAPPRAVRAVVEDAATLLTTTAADPSALASLEATPPVARLAARWIDPRAQAPLQRALARWERARPSLTAADLKQLGVSRGPDIGAWLLWLRRERYLGNLTRAAAARAQVSALLAIDGSPRVG